MSMDSGELRKVHIDRVLEHERDKVIGTLVRKYILRPPIDQEGSVRRPMVRLEVDAVKQR
jgi:hypothetical protein